MGKCNCLFICVCYVFGLIKGPVFRDLPPRDVRQLLIYYMVVMKPCAQYDTSASHMLKGFCDI